MVRRHHQFNGREFEQTPGVIGEPEQPTSGDTGGHGHSPWGHNQSDTTQ